MPATGIGTGSFREHMDALIAGELGVKRTPATVAAGVLRSGTRRQRTTIVPLIPPWIWQT